MAWVAALADANAARLSGGEMGALRSVGVGERRQAVVGCGLQRDNWCRADNWCHFASQVLVKLHPPTLKNRPTHA
jgi:hypothetical protein